MSTSPYGAYLESSVLSAAPLQLVHLAYEGAIKAIIEARGHLAAKRIHERSTAITRVQLILIELNRALDFQRGTEVATRLASLYDYMLKRLAEANFKQAEEPLAEVQELLTTLDEAWKELATPESSVATAAGANPWNTSAAEAAPRVSYSF